MAKEVSFINALSEKVKEDGMLSIVDTSQTFSGATIPFGVRTGVPCLDLALGRPGWPAGRIIELYGFEGSGKTTLGLHAIAQVQRMGGMGIFIDSEFTFDAHRAEQIGVSQVIGEDFFRIEASTVEAGFRAIQKIAQSVVESGNSRPIVIVYDSVTGSNLEYNVTKQLEIGVEGRVGQEARTIRNGLRTIVADIASTKIVLILINHAIARMAMTPYSKTSQSAGGHAIKLFASARCELKAIGKLKDENKLRTGAKTGIFIEKSKVGGLSIENIEVELLNSKGFDTIGNLFEAYKLSGLLEWPKSARSGTLKFIDPGRTIAKSDWESFVSEIGGVDFAYDKFYAWCLQEKLMIPYGELHPNV